MCRVVGSGGSCERGDTLTKGEVKPAVISYADVRVPTTRPLSLTNGMRVCLRLLRVGVRRRRTTRAARRGSGRDRGRGRDKDAPAVHLRPQTITTCTATCPRCVFWRGSFFFVFFFL